MRGRNAVCASGDHRKTAAFPAGLSAVFRLLPLCAKKKPKRRILLSNLLGFIKFGATKSVISATAVGATKAAAIGSLY